MGRKHIAFVVFMALLAVIAASCTVAGGQGQIEWLYDWSEASSKAQAENKPIMINFYTDMCPACRKLDQETFTNEELADFLNDSFICLKSNAGRTGLHARYGLSGVPTTIFTGQEGFEIGRIVGFWRASQFRQGALAALDLWQQQP